MLKMIRNNSSSKKWLIFCWFLTCRGYYCLILLINSISLSLDTFHFWTASHFRDTDNVNWMDSLFSNLYLLNLGVFTLTICTTLYSTLSGDVLSDMSIITLTCTFHPQAVDFLLLSVPYCKPLILFELSVMLSIPQFSRSHVLTS